MATDKIPKISKTQAIQLIDEQIDQFSLLLSSGAPADPEEIFSSSFRQTVSLICQLLSTDDAINFIEIIASYFKYKDISVVVAHDPIIENIYTTTLYKSVKDLFIKKTDKEKLFVIFTKVFFEVNDLEENSSNSLMSKIKSDLFIFSTLLSNGRNIEEEESKKRKKAIVKASINCIEQLRLYKMKIVQTWKDDQLYSLYSIGNITDSDVRIVQGEGNTVGSDKED